MTRSGSKVENVVISRAFFTNGINEVDFQSVRLCQDRVRGENRVVSLGKAFKVIVH